MIVRDEADGLGSVLSQAREFCDELVVLDTGSVDDTVQVAKNAGATVYETEWPNSFAKARNQAQDLTTQPWVIHLDGHDYLPPETVEGIKRIKEEDLPNMGDHDAVMLFMTIVNPEGEPLLSYPRERITRRDLRWQGDAHTIINPHNPIKRPYSIHTMQRTGNKPKRALSVLEEKYAAGDRSPRTTFYLARERFWAKKYVEAIPLYLDWLDMYPCAWEKYSGLIDLAACYLTQGEQDAAQMIHFQAVSTIPTRAEAWAGLALQAINRKDFSAARVYLRNCVEAQRPDEGFVVEKWYGHYPKQLLESLPS